MQKVLQQGARTILPPIQQAGNPPPGSAVEHQLANLSPSPPPPQRSAPSKSRFQTIPPVSVHLSPVLHWQPSHGGLKCWQIGHSQ